jgi:pimeloyl-ACP methyl ester carboxylesterase
LANRRAARYFARPSGLPLSVSIRDDTRNARSRASRAAAGERDWGPAAQRERTAGLIPRVKVKTIGNGGHFLSLDRPTELSELIAGFAAPARESSCAV